MFDINAPAPVLPADKILPLRLYSDVAFKLWICFHVLDVHLAKHIEHTIHQHRVHAFTLIILADRDQHQVHTVIHSQRTHDMQESEWK